MQTDKIHLLEDAEGEARKWTTFISPYRNYDWSVRDYVICCKAAPEWDFS